MPRCSACSTVEENAGKGMQVSPVMCTHCSIDDCLHHECGTGLIGGPDEPGSSHIEAI